MHESHVAKLTPAQQQGLIHAFGTHEIFCRESLQVRDRIGKLQAFESWPSQKKLSAAIIRQQNAGVPVRILVLKTRRSGFTLGSCSHVFKECSFMAGRRGTVIGDTYDPAAMEAFGYLKDFNENYIPFARYGCSLRLRNLRAADMALKEGDREVIDVFSAERGEIRGGGRHWLLGDEVAFWRAPEETMRAALTMIPDLPETGIIIQSTANGMAGEFYERCKRAQDPALASGFLFLFFGWLEDENNRREFESLDEAGRFQRSLDKEEVTLQQRHQANLEQLNWRRWKIEDYFGGRVEDFHQEYPTTPDEAFLTTGRTRFDMGTLARQPVQEGTYGELTLTDDLRPRILFQPGRNGSLTVWKPPQAGRWYVAGSDPSKGKDVSEGQRGSDPDWSVTTVHDGETGEQVAMLRERLRPFAFGEQTALLCRWYNWAFLVPESNDPGYIDAILQAKYPLERIYHQQRDPSDRRSKTLEEIGFYTTEASRNWLIGALEEALLTGSIHIRSSIVVSECRTFVIKPNGKAEHQVGCHDDTVFASALMCIGRRSAPRHVMTVPASQEIVTKPQKWGRAADEDDEDDRHVRRYRP